MRPLPRASRRRYQPVPEVLESRVALAVTPVLIPGGTLRVTMDARGDVANFGTSPVLNVNGTLFHGVRAIEVVGNGAGLQTVNFNGDVFLTGILSAHNVSAVNLNGSYTAAQVSFVMSSPSQGIRGTGGLTALGDVQLDAHAGPIELNGPNNFRAHVKIRAAEVALATTGDLRLDAMKVAHNATLTSRSLSLFGKRDDYASLDGHLVLQPYSRDASMVINGYAGGEYILTPEALGELTSSGFRSWTFGRADGRHAITINRLTSFNKPTTLRTPDGGSITVDAAISHSSTTDASLTLLAPRGVIRLNADISGTGSRTRLVGPVVIGQSRNFDRKPIEIISAPLGNAPGGISIEGSINDDSTPSVLTIRAGLTNVDLGAVGNVRPLGGLRIDDARDVTVQGPVKAGFFHQKGGVGITTVNGTIETTGKGEAVELSNRKVVLNGLVSAPGQTIILRTYREGLTVNAGLIAHHLVVNGSGPQLIQGPSRINLLTASVSGSMTMTNMADLATGSYEGTRGVSTRGGALTLIVQGKLTIGSPGGGNIDASGGLFTIRADSVTQAHGAYILASGLAVAQAGSVQLNDPSNDVDTLAADIAGDLSYRDRDSLTIGKLADINGIRTQGGNVQIHVDGPLRVNAPIDTRPGTGGQLSIQGDPQNVILNVAPTLGAGNITFIVPGLSGLALPTLRTGVRQTSARSTQAAQRA